MSMSTKRACDACHRRKIRCAGGQPCGNCGHASLNCTYNAIPRKKGPKGSRAKVITELREKQQPRTTSWQTAGGISGNPDAQERLCQFTVPMPESVDKQLVYSCIDAFFTHMYPTMPIFDRHQLQGRVKDMDRSINAYCVVISLCAFVMIQPGLPGNDTSSRSALTTRDCLVSGKALFEEAARVRRMGMAIDNPSADAVITAFFLFTCSFGLERHNTAWFYLREATTLAEILGMNDESHYASSTEVTFAIRQRRLFWLLFVTERSYALQRHRPLTLHPTISLPALHEIPSESTTTSGFLHLVNLFRPFDDTFIGLWNQTRTQCTMQALAHMQKRLVNILPIPLNSTESQAVDLRISQQWLRTVIWRLSVSKGFLSSISPDAAMRFTYPIDIAGDLVRDMEQFSNQLMDIHGIGLIEKVFDVTCALMDVMSCLPQGSPAIRNTTLTIGARHYLNQLCTRISQLRGGDSRFLPILLTRLDKVDPSMNSPLLVSPSLTPEDYFSFSDGSSRGSISCSSESTLSPDESDRNNQYQL